MSDLNLNQIFDVIIVGAGAAGCVLASRLSEREDKNILLIEAGPDAVKPGAEHPDLLDPFCLMATHNATFRWPGLAARTGAAKNARHVPYIQGHSVGGGSNINGMAADRGIPDDYDEWRDLGAKGWGWNEVLPYFRKMSRDLDFPSSETGPMPVRRITHWGNFSAALAEVLQRRGYAFLEDYMSDFREGFAAVPTNGLPDRRMSTAMAYLTSEVRRRPNLTILADTRADRIGFEGQNANGIYVFKDDQTMFLRGREVIVSCGALFSPTLLMRSGVGPGAHLMRHGIPVVRDVPAVGANLQNHPCISLTTYLPRDAMQAPDNPAFMQHWLRFSSHHRDCPPNDMHFMCFNKCGWHELGRRMGMVAVTVMRSYSQGRVELVSTDPAVLPRVDFHLLSDARDYERLVKGLRFTLELLADPAVTRWRRQAFFPNDRLVANLSVRNGWNSFKATTLSMILDCAPLRALLLAPSRIDPDKLLADETARRDFVRAHAHPQLHVSGTCRMGRADDAQAVTDGAGRVHGVQGLRVIDASLFPTMPRGYPHFLTIMTAEKLADCVFTASP